MHNTLIHSSYNIILLLGDPGYPGPPGLRGDRGQKGKDNISGVFSLL